MKTIGILVFDDVEELDFVGPLEVFGMAARHGADCRIVLIGVERKEVRSRYGLRVQPDAAIDEAPQLDTLIVPGGLGAATTHHNSLQLLRESPNVDVREGSRFIIHERVATSAGVSAGIDLALALVTKWWGPSLASTVAVNLEWKM